VSFLTKANAVASTGYVTGMQNGFVGDTDAVGSVKEAVLKSTTGTNWIYEADGTTDGASGAIDTNTTYLVVFKLNMDTGKMTGYMNPTDLTDVLTSSTKRSITNITTWADMPGFLFALGTSESGYIDEIRVGGNLGAVVPYYESPADQYVNWLTNYPGLGTETNLIDNPDADALDNLAEYGLGGNPDDGNDIGYEPVYSLVEDSGTNYFEYVTIRRTTPNSGLSYTVEINTDLINGVWTNSSVWIGNEVLDSDFTITTNRISTEIEDEQFLRLKVELQ